MNRPVKGNFVRIINKEKKWNENEEYQGIHVQMLDGEEKFGIFTDREVAELFGEAFARAARNPEDYVNKPWINDIID